MVGRYRVRNGDIFLAISTANSCLERQHLQRHSSNTYYGMNLLLMRFNQDICDTNYIDNLFKIYRDKGIFIGLASRAVGQASINQGRLRALDIPLPPLPEQQAIARVLSTIQKAMRRRTKSLPPPESLKVPHAPPVYLWPGAVTEADKVRSRRRKSDQCRSIGRW